MFYFKVNSMESPMKLENHQSISDDYKVLTDNWLLQAKMCCLIT